MSSSGVVKSPPTQEPSNRKKRAFGSAITFGPITGSSIGTWYHMRQMLISAVRSCLSQGTAVFRPMNAATLPG